MRAIHNFHKREHGQIIVIVALAMVALIAMAMLLLDGGALLVNRRAAQNAADAAALAGARVYCKLRNATEDDIIPIIEDYAEDYNGATVLWGKPHTYIDPIDPDNENEIEGVVKGEVVVTVQVEHESFFAKLFGKDMLTATATAAAGCFPYGPDVVLPIAFPCQAPSLGKIDGVTAPNEVCDFSMLLWSYFDDIATDVCGMTSNPLGGGVEPTQEDINCISETLITRHKELIYVVMTEGRICAKDPENIDPNNEIICDINQEGHSQLSSSEHGWLNLYQTNNNANPSSMGDWILGISVPPVREHTWLSFATGLSVNPVFTDLQTRLLEIVWLPIYNYACPYRPVEGDYSDKCWKDAHEGWWEDVDGDGVFNKEVDISHPGVPDPYKLDPLNDCYVVDNLPGQEFAHVVGFAPFFVTCIRDGSKDLKDYLNDKDNTTPEDFISECPGFEMAVKTKIKLDDGNIVYPNFAALEDANYTLEGYFIEPWYLDNPESLNLGGLDTGIYTAHLTR